MVAPMEFSPFDNRGYPTLSVTEGYSAWAETYEDTVFSRFVAMHDRPQHVVIDAACELVS